MIELHDLTKVFGEVTAVDHLHLEIERGEAVFLVGGSGCGKTTTLKMVNRLVEPTSGTVRIDHRDTSQMPPWELRRRIGYGFQQVGLFPHLSVGENIAITPKLMGWKKSRIARRVDELLDLMVLAPDQFRDRSPEELSGGQAQRVGLARALAAEPEILLLDEPFGALDPVIRDRLQVFFRDLRRELELTVLFVTHDMVEALLLADRIVVMDAGAVVQIGSPSDLLRAPANRLVANLMETPRRHARLVDELLESTSPHQASDASSESEPSDG